MESSSQYGKEGGREKELGEQGLWPENEARARCQEALGLRGVAKPRLRVSMALRGPVGRAGGGGGP